MARSSLSYEEVVNAINQIVAQNDKLSINKIRETIGHGSPTTISKFFKQWEEENPSKPQTMESEPVEVKVDPTPNKTQPQRTTMDTMQKPKQRFLNPNDIKDPIIQSLLINSEALSCDIFNSMSDEWRIILNEPNVEVKVKKLYAALVKEQTRRETAEKIAEETKIYADIIKNQTTQRITDLRDSLESQIAFLNGQIRQLKREAEADLQYYRQQLEKSNAALAELKK